MPQRSLEKLRSWSLELFELCRSGEYALRQKDLGTAVCKMRCIAEWLVNQAYKGWNLQLPVQNGLFDLVSNTAFRDLVPPVVVGKLHLIRKIGNQGVHGQNISFEDAQNGWAACLDVLDYFYLNILVAQKIAAGEKVCAATEMKNNKEGVESCEISNSDLGRPVAGGRSVESHGIFSASGSPSGDQDCSFPKGTSRKTPLRKRILDTLRDYPQGIDDDSLARILCVRYRQQINSRCRDLERQGLIERRRVDGKIHNFLKR